MASLSPQLDVQQTLTLSQADILQLNTVPFVAISGVSGFGFVFRSANINYRYKNAAFTNVSNTLSFKIKPVTGSPILVSNSLGADNFLGLTQNTNFNFIPANPFTPLPTNLNGADLIFMIEGADPLGGDAASQISIILKYDILQLA